LAFFFFGGADFLGFSRVDQSSSLSSTASKTVSSSS
jgi:hypothetical protein